VSGALKELCRGCGLDDFSEVHYRDAVRDVTNDREVVSDEQYRDLHLFLEPLEKLENLCLDAHVERAHRFVGHEQVRLDRQRPGDSHALLLSPAELVWIPVDLSGVEPDALEEIPSAVETVRL
jgi:hypothetical protein